MGLERVEHGLDGDDRRPVEVPVLVLVHVRPAAFLEVAREHVLVQIAAVFQAQVTATAASIRRGRGRIGKKVKRRDIVMRAATGRVGRAHFPSQSTVCIAEKIQVSVCVCVT